MDNFRFNLIKSEIAKELVRGLLEDSGYNAYAFGYLSWLSHIRYHVKMKCPPQTDSIKRLRSTPDLIVFDEQNGETWYVDVKFRRTDNPREVKLQAESLVWYQQYWNDSVLVVVVPTDHIFYAQYVDKLGQLSCISKHEGCIYDVTKDFLPIEEIFRSVDQDTIKKYHSLYSKFPMMNIHPGLDEEFYDDYDVERPY